MRRPRVLFVVEQCNPEWASVPLIGFRLYEALASRADVTLVTHARNRGAFERLGLAGPVQFIEESERLARWYARVEKWTTKAGVNWALLTALSYPIYASFNRQVYEQFYPRVRAGEWDLVHAFSPVLPRYPVRLAYAEHQTPVVLGPVNGGLAYPEAFRSVGRREFAQFNVLRHACRFIPGYLATYKHARKILVGADFVRQMLEKSMQLPSTQFCLFHENGIPDSFLRQEARVSLAPDQKLELLFVGRLVPYKGADMLIEALSQLPQPVLERVHLTIVGDGSERAALESQAQGLPVSFTGWVEQQETKRYYQHADLFCFPSVREFGGGVALEAMAAGLPCIVVDYGGLAEYVTQACGIKIEARSREHVCSALAAAIVRLRERPDELLAMSLAARQRAEDYRWSARADRLMSIYEDLLEAHRTAG